jgi:hypothetical protein
VATRNVAAIKVGGMNESVFKRAMGDSFPRDLTISPATLGSVTDGTCKTVRCELL